MGRLNNKTRRRPRMETLPPPLSGAYSKMFLEQFTEYAAGLVSAFQRDFDNLGIGTGEQLAGFG
jgi:hypothetical protein